MKTLAAVAVTLALIGAAAVAITEIGGETLQPLLEEVFSVEAASWKGESQTAMALDPLRGPRRQPREALYGAMIVIAREGGRSSSRRRRKSARIVVIGCPLSLSRA